MTTHATRWRTLKPWGMSLLAERGWRLSNHILFAPDGRKFQVVWGKFNPFIRPIHFFDIT